MKTGKFLLIFCILIVVTSCSRSNTSAFSTPTSTPKVIPTIKSTDVSFCPNDHNWGELDERGIVLEVIFDDVTIGEVNLRREFDSLIMQVTQADGYKEEPVNYGTLPLGEIKANIYIEGLEGQEFTIILFRCDNGQIKYMIPNIDDSNL